MKTNALASQLKLKHLLIVALFTLALAGCGNGEMDGIEDLKDFVKNAGADMRGKVSPPPDVNLHPAIPFKASSSVPQPFDPVRLQSVHR